MRSGAEGPRGRESRPDKARVSARPLEPTDPARPPASPGSPFAALRRAWSAPRSPQVVVLVLAAWLVVAGNLALWRSLVAIESGPRGVLIALGVAVVGGR